MCVLTKHRHGPCILNEVTDLNGFPEPRFSGRVPKQIAQGQADQEVLKRYQQPRDDVIESSEPISLLLYYK